MKKIMMRITLASLVFLAGSAVWYWQSLAKLALTVMITALVVAYQFGMRLLIGDWLEKYLPHQVAPDRGWFRVGRFEQRLYQWLRVKKWKQWLPTYQPDSFDIHTQAFADILQAGCLAEIDHELMMLLSYLPLVLTIVWGNFGIFLLTSVLASLVDLPFVILQRFNRPRLLRLAHRQARKGSLG